MISIQNQANTLNRFLPTSPVEIIIKDVQRDKWLYFKQPLTLFETHDVNSVAGQLERIESQVNSHGLIAVGFLSYEAAPAFDDALTVRTSAFPKLWFGLFEAWDEIKPDSLPSDKNYKIGRWSPSMSHNDYEKAIRKIKKHIRCGDTYQVNFTYQLHSAFSGDALAYFRRLNDAQGGRYAAFLSTTHWSVCSVSPELFFHLDGEDIVAKPMKGTFASGKRPQKIRKRLVFCTRKKIGPETSSSLT
jgi:para-aminobenzoate synthetase/4-amino-4-deoxychorismate lyase